MKKVLSLIMALALLLTCMSLTVLAEDEDWITLRVEAFDRSITGFNVEDCMQLRFAQENFGDPNHIKIEFVPVSRWEEEDTLTRLMGASSAPDLCMTYSGNLDGWILDGAVKPLGDLVDEYGANLTAFLGDELLSYGIKTVNGTEDLYLIPARRISVANVGNFIRQDWLDELGMEKPTTIEELTEYLYAAKDANLGGEITCPFNFGLYKQDPLINVKRFTDPFIEFSKVTEEDWFAYSENHEMLPGSKEGYRWLNQLYNDGLMPEGFEVDDGTIADRNRVMGYTGFFTEQPDQPWRTDRNFSIELKKNVGENAEWVTVNCFANIEDGRTLHDIYQANGLSVFIPYWVEDDVAVAAVMYLDWMAQPENMFVLQNGIEGINFDYLGEDGIPVGAKGTDLVEDQYKMHAGDICFIANGLWYGDMETSNAAIAKAFPGFEELVEESYADSYTDTWTDISFTVPLEAVTDYGETVKVKQGEFLINVVTCAPEDFDAVYDEYIQNILDAGADKIIEARREAYQEGNYRGTFPYAD